MCYGWKRLWFAARSHAFPGKSCGGKRAKTGRIRPIFAPFWPVSRNPRRGRKAGPFGIPSGSPFGPRTGQKRTKCGSLWDPFRVPFWSANRPKTDEKRVNSSSELKSHFARVDYEIKEAEVWYPPVSNGVSSQIPSGAIGLETAENPFVTLLRWSDISFDEADRQPRTAQTPAPPLSFNWFLVKSPAPSR